MKERGKFGVLLIALVSGHLISGSPENLKSIREKAELGNAFAQLELGWRYQQGIDLPQENSAAFQWYSKAAEQGLASAQCNLGLMYMEGQGVETDKRVALDWFHSAAHQGHALAMYNIGLAHLSGDGVIQDYEEAIKWFRKAAIDRNPKWESDAGGIYQNSDSVPWASHERGRNADQGRLSAQNQLGLMYALGQGVGQDDREALKWYRKAAEQDYAIAQRNLAAMYQKGHGTAQNTAESMKWFRRAAERGDVQAQNHLGVLHTMGTGVEQDLIQAFQWFTLSAATGNEYGIESRNALTKHLSPDEIAEGQQRAREVLAEIRNRDLGN